MTWQPIPHVAVAGRREVCRVCPTPCSAYVAGELNHADERATCPLPEPRWRPWGEVIRRQRMRRQRMRTRGIGDAVAVVAQPIARVIDKVAGTDLAHCKGCGQRQAALNTAGEALANRLRGNSKPQTHNPKPRRLPPPPQPPQRR